MFIACHLSEIYLQSERKAWFSLAQNIQFFISKAFEYLFRKKRCSLQIAVPEFQTYKKKKFSISAESLKNNTIMNFFIGTFQGFCLHFKNTYLKEHP